MSRHNTHNLVYFASKSKEKKSETEDSLSDKKLKEILKTVAQQAMRERSPDLNELESILQNSVKESEEKNHPATQENDDDGSSSITKLLQEKGYLKDKKNWLTNKGFFEIGEQILQDVMKNLNSSEYGLHETKNSGDGNVTMDTTKRFEPGDDIKYLNVPQTILNSIKRLSKNSVKIDFPLSLEPEDLEEYETLEDVRAAIVYCIDLSSTMKQSLTLNGKSRIEAAKKALWSLYVLNKKFFPNDSISVVGFGSMASIVNPLDIPFLKTYDANDNFLHYTNYQAALRLARKILGKTSTHNKRIVLITDGQPSACYIDNEYQKNEIISEKPYSNFYTPDKSVISKVQSERNMKLETEPNRLVYLCYRYKKVDPKIDKRTIIEAKKCKREGIDIDTIVVSEEPELLDYARTLEKQLRGKTYHINQENMDQILVIDYLDNTKKVLNSKQTW
jgi:uncharacterized protein with von Willebrand factor type A (vWA) domain